MDYKAMLLSLLGLPATATDAEIEAKRTSAATDMAQSHNRATENTQLKTQLAELTGQLIDADLERFKAVIVNEEDARELLQLNREKAVKFFEGQLSKCSPAPAGGKGAVVYQKNRAKAPDGKELMEEEVGDDNPQAVAKFRSIQSRAAALVAERKIPFAQAFEIAKAEVGA